jgi:hypothetical protein
MIDKKYIREYNSKYLNYKLNLQRYLNGGKNQKIKKITGETASVAVV